MSTRHSITEHQTRQMTLLQIFRRHGTWNSVRGQLATSRLVQRRLGSKQSEGRPVGSLDSKFLRHDSHCIKKDDTHQMETKHPG
jgi:hypothetical protein